MARGLRWLMLSLVLIASCAITESGMAVEPFENRSFPQGPYFLTYPAYYSAKKLTDKDGNIVNNNLGLKLYQTQFRFLYYNKTTFKNTWAFSAILSVGRKELSGNKDEGIGDPTVNAGYWLIDDPETKTWFPVLLYVDIPIGSYDASQKVNLGANVWKFRPVIGFEKQFGNLDVSVMFRYNFYTENKEATVQGTRIKEGNEAYFESYLGYFVVPRIVVGGHLNAVIGRNRIIDNAEKESSALRRYQAGGSVVWRASDKFGIAFETLQDFGNRNCPKGQLYFARLAWRL